jgi:beta-N-acetylhexosaminidase
VTGIGLRAQIGRLLCVGIPGPMLDAATRETLVALHVGGIILFRRNTGSPAEIAALTAALHALPSRPFVAIDHEGGRVLRLGEPFTCFPSAAAIGATGEPQVAYRVGHAMAAELASVGFDVNFAPVLDVHSNPANPVIGDRAFGSDPELVGKMGVAMLRGLLAGGVLACGKHFPGHGDTAVDSHLARPVVDRPRPVLERTELPPFRMAIRAGVPMLMTAHVLYPALDAACSATTSRPIITGLLRRELQFDGVVVSDDLEMRAITAHQPIGAAAVDSLQAGCDLLLVCQELARAVEAFEAIEQAVGSGVLSSADLAAASQRVEQLGVPRATPPAQICRLPNPAHRALAEEIGNLKLVT